MKSAIEAQISGNTSPDADALRAQLDALVQQAAVSAADMVISPCSGAAGKEA